MANIVQGSFVRKVDNASHWINLYPVDNAIDFPNTVEPRLSGFLDYPDFFSGPNLVMNIYVTITIRSHILFKTTALKSAVKFCGFNTYPLDSDLSGG